MLTPHTEGHLWKLVVGNTYLPPQADPSARWRFLNIVLLEIPVCYSGVFVEPVDRIPVNVVSGLSSSGEPDSCQKQTAEGS